MSKYISAYGGGGKPLFFEGPVFKMIIPLAEGVIEGVTEGVKETLVRLIKAIADNEGMRIPDYAAKINEPVKSVEHYIKPLREVGLVEFKGSPRTGGYMLSQELHDKLHDK